MKRYRHNPDDPRRRHSLDDIYAAILRHMTETAGAPPTLREICAACGISSTSAASYALRSLEQTGRIVLVDGYRIRIPGATWQAPVEQFAEAARNAPVRPQEGAGAIFRTNV